MTIKILGILTGLLAAGCAVAAVIIYEDGDVAKATFWMAVACLNAIVSLIAEQSNG